MTNLDLPIVIGEIALLQAYLYQIFTTQSDCKSSFTNTEMYLNDKYNSDEVNSILNYFKENGLQCDCDIIYKMDLKEISKGIIKRHNQNC